MILVDYDLETFIFREPVQLFYTDGEQPLTMEVKTMAEVTDLLDYIHQNNMQPGIGGFSIELQLWFALARRSKFFKQDK